MNICASKITNWLIKNGAIVPSDRELYEYALYSMGITIAPLFLVLIIGAFMGALMEGIILIIPFIVVCLYNLDNKKEIELIDAEHSKERIMYISIIAILCAVIIIYIIRRQLQIRTAEKKQLEIEKKRYEQLYADAIAERDALTKMIEDSSVKDETKAVIRERLEVLNKVIISHITDTSSANKKAYQELEALVADKESFIESTRLTIEGNNPEFIAALKKQGLTDEEINICCLYIIGLKGKDIKSYTSQPRLYIQSAEIRHKLGLTENDTNLAIHLRNMLEKEVC